MFETLVLILVFCFMIPNQNLHLWDLQFYHRGRCRIFERGGGSNSGKYEKIPKEKVLTSQKGGGPSLKNQQNYHKKGPHLWKRGLPGKGGSTETFWQNGGSRPGHPPPHLVSTPVSFLWVTTVWKHAWCHADIIEIIKSFCMLCNQSYTQCQTIFCFLGCRQYLLSNC